MQELDKRRVKPRFRERRSSRHRRRAGQRLVEVAGEADNAVQITKSAQMERNIQAKDQDESTAHDHRCHSDHSDPDQPDQEDTAQVVAEETTMTALEERQNSWPITCGWSPVA